MIDRTDLILAAEALRAITRLDSPKLAELAIHHNVRLMTVASELRRMAGGAHPYMPMLTAADYLERVAKGQPGEIRVDFAVLVRAADDLDRLADEPPIERPRNRAERRASASARGREA